jgi:hypothetical protein
LSIRPKTTEHDAQSAPPLVPPVKALKRPSITGIKTISNKQIQPKFVLDIAAFSTKSNGVNTAHLQEAFT